MPGLRQLRSFWIRGWTRWLKGWPKAPSAPSPLVRVFTDGSAHEVPGRSGGWAFAVVRDETLLFECSGAERQATSSRMELLAARRGLEAVRARRLELEARIELWSDCRLVLEAALGNLPGGSDAGLASEVWALSEALQVTPRWVRAHSGVGWNERVDGLAARAKLSLVPAKVRRRAERRRALGQG